MDSANTQVAADDRIVQCEPINRELWLYIVDDLLVWCELELNNNIYKIVECMSSFTVDGQKQRCLEFCTYFFMKT